jgi:ribosome assembly protein 1
LRGKEQLIASARARGQTADKALASTDDAVAQDQLASLDSSAAKSESDTRAELRLLRDFENSVEAGFQMATFQGPLCAEPTVGMGWVVERIEHSKDEEEGEWLQA